VGIRRSTILTVVASLAVGTVAGGFVGFQIATRIWARLSRPLFAATAGQAYTVLSLLENGKEAEARGVLEREVDSALVTLRATASNEPNDRVARLYEQLEEYRRQHPHSPSQGPETK
jgi:hypothetical protein